MRTNLEVTTHTQNSTTKTFRYHQSASIPFGTSSEYRIPAFCIFLSPSEEVHRNDGSVGKLVTGHNYRSVYAFKNILFFGSFKPMRVCACNPLKEETAADVFGTETESM